MLWERRVRNPKNATGPKRKRKPCLELKKFPMELLNHNYHFLLFQCASFIKKLNNLENPKVVQLQSQMSTGTIYWRHNRDIIHNLILCQRWDKNRSPDKRRPPDVHVKWKMSHINHCIDTKQMLLNYIYHIKAWQATNTCK